MIELSDLNAQKAVNVCRIIRANGKEAFLVGGAIRDLLMGDSPKDYDIATNASPDQIMRWFPRVIPTGIKHGTVTVLDGEHSYEVTTYRGETSYSDGRHPDHTYAVHTIEEDLARRDFGMNAVAYCPLTDTFRDPFGGCADILLERIRCVGDPNQRLAEDGLRCLRACRFAATLGFEIDPPTKAAIINNVWTYQKVSVERIVGEWKKAFKADKPSIAFGLMWETGLLCATVPEFLDSIGLVQNKYHGYTVDRHTLAVLDAAPKDEIVQLAALLHDVAKPACLGINDKTGQRTFYNHEERGAEMTREIMTRLKFSSDEINEVSALVRHHLLPHEHLSAAAMRRWVIRVGAENVDRILMLAEADRAGKGPAEVKIPEDFVSRFGERLKFLATKSPIVSKTGQLALNGKDIMTLTGCAPGPIVGEILASLMDYVTEDPERNTRTALSEYLAVEYFNDVT